MKYLCEVARCLFRFRNCLKQEIRGHLCRRCIMEICAIGQTQFSGDVLVGKDGQVDQVGPEGRGYMRCLKAH